MRNGSARPGDVGRVAGEIDALRGELGGLVAELDRRRREALDLRLQARRHPVLVAAIAAAAALLVGGAIAGVVALRRHRHRPSVRARQVRGALGRLLEHPERVGATPSIGNKVATAVGVALATALARRLMDRAAPPPPARAR